MILDKVISDSDDCYIRSFESMGTGLLLIRIENINRINVPYHYLYENGWKPPLDIAINPINRTIDYIKFFLQDEQVGINHTIENLENIEGNVVTGIECFSQEKYEISFAAEFETSITNECLCILRKEKKSTKKVVIAKGVYILFTCLNEFSGVIIESLSNKEIIELEKSKMLDTYMKYILKQKEDEHMKKV